MVQEKWALVGDIYIKEVPYRIEKHKIENGVLVRYYESKICKMSIPKTYKDIIDIKNEFQILKQKINQSIKNLEKYGI